MNNNERTAKSCFELSDKIKWAHSVSEWEVMINSGLLFTKTDQGGKVIATCLLTPHKNGQSMGMVLVDPEYRNQGIGTEIVNRAIQVSQSFNEKSIRLVSSAMAERIYYKLGFVNIGYISVFSKALTACPSGSIGTTSANGKIVVNAGDLSDVYYDGCRKYDSLIATIVNSSNYSYVKYDKRNNVIGFCSSFDRISAECEHILAVGPMIARDEEVLDEMLDDIEITCCDRNKISCFIYTDLLHDSEEDRGFRHGLTEVFLHHGFVLENKHAFMINDISTADNVIAHKSVISPVSLAFG